MTSEPRASPVIWEFALEVSELMLCDSEPETLKVDSAPW